MMVGLTPETNAPNSLCNPCDVCDVCNRCKISKICNTLFRNVVFSLESVLSTADDGNRFDSLDAFDSVDAFDEYERKTKTLG
jgi:hypothetical protein